jgi:16S rRNA (uracil1498-N3)-methyltransferase
MGQCPRGAAAVIRPRFHVPEAAPGARVVLPDHAARHAREVLRLRSGAAVRIFDGRGAEFEGVLDTVSRRVVEAHLAGPVAARPESPLPLVLALPPLKGDLMELVIQKTTELGVSAIRPVITTRTDAVARPALQGSRQERWNKVASGAAEQCGRAVVPLVAPTAMLRDLLATPFEGRRLFLLETGGTPALASLGSPRAGEAVLLLLGPPGGWEESEVDAAGAAGFAAAGLGPRILRSETAAISAVAIAQSLWGDLR